MEVALELKIPYFTFWGSSLDNIEKRPKAEVEFLFKIFEKEFKKLLTSDKVSENGVRVNVLGRWQELFPKSLVDLMKEIIAKTKDYSNYHLTFLMAYSGLDEMKTAVQRIADNKIQDSDFKIDGDSIKANLWTRDLPPVDLVIRTGGEPHWSNGLMMWDVADAQLYFTETLYPDFSPEEFKKALMAYGKTSRRFGA
ncbi:MAG: Isoprenyl transferase [Candidatus Jorgensenbacteria bacterium GW2011_GWA1_48_11]|uniref:Isoprenyl transferase n=1 Tax=Candidatus Jorgensenbacteria bacterium GW2011_GWA1_48_11 TaxID=1618660 RepID=A0A0G1WMU8_9BACT|nr:MAG: Isoprenyl transferase [Candidatus Jorgensenbacteria bacterium GW2011_GWA1_48_11]KKW12145.1 MAG: Isoprenyl transferase [Candidatus Jorgensenbacteria bacterium GW2011_GWB1_49_9]